MSFIGFSTALARIFIAGGRLALVFFANIPLTFVTVLAIAAIVLLFQIPYLGSLAVLPYIYMSNLLTFLGLMKRGSTWCVVYDSKTKLPIDPAYVTVRDMQGKEVSSIITDLNGRFSLLLPRGLYTIEASKTNYTFPSAVEAGSKTDGKYNNLYFGSVVEIEDQERSIAISIPMDPAEEDWNQVEKRRKDLFYRFDDKDTYFHASKTYTAIAFILSLILACYYPSDVSFKRLFMILILMGIVSLYTWRHRQYAHSFVVDAHTKLPIAFAKVSIFSAKTKNKVSQKITSFEGQFTCLLSQGTYYITIEKRNDQGAYELVFTSPSFSVNDGYIGKRFTV